MVRVVMDEVPDLKLTVLAVRDEVSAKLKCGTTNVISGS